METTIIMDQMNEDDWKQVCDIYEEGISTGIATFEKKVPTWEEWDCSHLQMCRIVARLGDKIVGWAALSAVSSRAVYAGVAEVSIYVAQSSRGKNIGSKLMEILIEESENKGFWTLQSGILPKNEISIQLHLKHGFREVGRRERIGKMNGTWHDLVLLERRSKSAGVNE